MPELSCSHHSGGRRTRNLTEMEPSTGFPEALVTVGCGAPLTGRSAAPLLCPSGLHVPGEVE